MAKKKKESKHVPLDPKEREHIEDCIKRIKEFQALWLDFYFRVRGSFLGEPVTAEQELKFLQVKSEVAMRHQYLYELLGQHYLGAQLLTDLLRKVVNLEKVSKTASENYYKIERFWHEYFVNLQESMVALQFRLELEDQQA
jgi:hypothetical protein